MELLLPKSQTENKRMFGRQSEVHIIWRQTQKYSVECERNQQIQLNKMLFLNYSRLQSLMSYNKNVWPALTKNECQKDIHFKTNPNTYESEYPNTYESKYLWIRIFMNRNIYESEYLWIRILPCKWGLGHFIHALNIMKIKTGKEK